MRNTGRKLFLTAVLLLPAIVLSVNRLLQVGIEVLVSLVAVSAIGVGAVLLLRRGARQHRRPRVHAAAGDADVDSTDEVCVFISYESAHRDDAKSLKKSLRAHRIRIITQAEDDVLDAVVVMLWGHLDDAIVRRIGWARRADIPIVSYVTESAAVPSELQAFPVARSIIELDKKLRDITAQRRTGRKHRLATA